MEPPSLPLSDAWRAAAASTPTSEPHVRAIAAHNAALAAEIGYLRGGARPDDLIWRTALGAWRDCLADRRFWTLQRDRIRRIDDPALKEDDLEEVVTELPGALLNAHRALAHAYLRAGTIDDARRHATLLCREATGTLSYVELQRMLNDVMAAFAERPLSAVRQDLARLAEADPKLGFRDAARRLAPTWKALDDAVACIPSALMGGAPASQLGIGGPFDVTAGLLQAVRDRAVTYQGDERTRALQWGLLATARQLEYPISAGCQGVARTAMQDHLGLLYKDFYAERDQSEVTKIRADDCFFCPGQPADPEHSVLLPVHLVTERDAVRTRFMTRTVLVPRSAYAAAIHAARKAEPVSRDGGPDSIQGKIRDVEQRGAETVARLETARESALRAADETAAPKLAEFDAANRERLGALHETEGDAVAALRAAMKSYDARVGPLETRLRDLPAAFFADLAATVTTRATQAFDDASKQISEELGGTETRARDAAVKGEGISTIVPFQLIVACSVASAIIGAGIGVLPSVSGTLGAHLPQIGPSGTFATPILFGLLGLLPVPLLYRLFREDLREPVLRFLSAFFPAERKRLDDAVKRAGARAKEAVSAEASALTRHRVGALGERLSAVLKDWRTEALSAEQARVDRAQADLKQLADHRDSLVKRASTARQALNADYEKRIADQRAQDKRRIEELRRQLVPPTPKRQAEQNQFPAYLAAKRKGYRDGARPASSW